MSLTAPIEYLGSRPLFARPVVVVALMAAGFVLLWGLPLLITPLSTDEAYYALGGRTVLNGDRLYVDLWDIKPPLVYLIYAVPMAIGGESDLSIRIFTLLCAAVTVAGVFLLTRRFFGQRAGVFAAGLYSFSYFALAGFVALGEAESFMVAPLIFAFFVYQTRDERRSLPAAFAAGLLLGCAIALKFSAALIVLGLPLAELLLREREGWTPRGAVIRLTYAAAGFLFVQAVWIGYLLLEGVWDEFYDIQTNYTIPYMRFRWAPEGTDYWRSVIESTGGWMVGAAYLTIPAWAALFFGLARGPWRPVQFLSLLVLLSFAAVWWQGKLFHYHWLTVVPFLACLGGYACSSLLDILPPIGERRTYAVALLLGGFIVTAIAPVLDTYDGYKFLVRRVSGDMSQIEVEQRYFWELTLNRQLIDQIRARGDEDDSFYIWGFWTTPYWWEDRPLPTSFVSNHGLRAVWADPEWRVQLMQDLEDTNPRFIVIAAGDHQPWLTGSDRDSHADLCENFLGLRRFIEESYQPVLNNGLFVLYDREAPAPTAFPRCAG
jgi:4-amino-4-deoxy-L-arabinose transferase-like glycosyltransferase